MRCPECGATNGDTATFCGQCHTSFAAPPPAAPPPAAPPEESISDLLGGLYDPEPQPPAPPGQGGQPPPAVAKGRFVAVGDQMGWTCAVCDEINEITTFTCRICGARMDAERGQGTGVDWDAAKRVEAVLPGVGHMKAGLQGAGLARIVVAGFCLLGALALSTGGLAGVLTALPMVIGLLVLMLLGPGDLEAARHGRPGRLEGRSLGILVGGVLMGVIVIGAAQALLRG